MSQPEWHADLVYILYSIFELNVQDHVLYMQTICSLFLDTFKSEKEHCLKQHCAKWINSLRFPVTYNFTEGINLTSRESLGCSWKSDTVCGLIESLKRESGWVIILDWVYMDPRVLSGLQRKWWRWNGRRECIEHCWSTTKNKCNQPELLLWHTLSW